MSTSNSYEFTPFHSSVNRIPSIRAHTSKLSPSHELHFLRDQTPEPISEINQEQLSGSISVRATVETPLITGSQQRPKTQTTKSGNTREITTIRPYIVDDKTFIPPTMFKGMLSNAFEALTNSRYRIFDEHNAPLTYRIDPATSASLMPVRINHSDSGEVFIDLLDGSHSHRNSISDTNREIPVVLAASLYDGTTSGITLMEHHPQSSRHSRPLPGSTGSPRDRFIAASSPKSGDPFPEIFFDAALVSNGLYAYWIVTALYKSQHQKEPDYTFDIDFNELKLNLIDRECSLKGYLYTTTNPLDRKASKSTFKDKKSERIFFSFRETPQRIKLSQDKAKELFSRYENTVQSYRNMYKKQEKLASRKRQDKPIPNRFITDQSWSIADHGSLAYAILSDDQSEIIDLVPIPIGRASYVDTPTALAKTNMLTPPASDTDASTADRLFGFTTTLPSGEHNSNHHQPHYSLKGRLSFNSIDTSSCRRYKGTPIELEPLLEPKPSSARRFLTTYRGENIQPSSKNRAEDTTVLPIRRQDYFLDGKQSLGRATYPTHRAPLDLPYKDRRIRPVSPESEAFSIVESYILPGSQMTMTIHFEMLTSLELSILLWLLKPENLVPHSERGKGLVGYLRLGMGKPLGYGTLRVEATELRLQTGQQLATRYTQLDGCLGTETIRSIDHYQVPDHFEELRWVQAFQRASFGYTDGIPVRYMTRKENQQNNATNFDDGYPKEGRALEVTQLFPSPSSGEPICVPRPV